MSFGWILLLVFYAVAFLIVTWPIHWLMQVRKRGVPSDLRFHRQRAFWRLYFVVFGTAVLLTVGVLLIRGQLP